MTASGGERSYSAPGGGTATGREVQRSAAEWFALLLDDKITDSDSRAFRRWLSEDERNARAYAEIERLWSGVGILPDPAGTKKRRRAFLKGGAAVLALLCGGAYVRQTMGRADFQTSAGETAAITLPDGSHVRLSTATSLDLAFGNDVRGLRLLAGEAYFEVAADQSRPFTVFAGDTSITALGTAFSVRLEEPDVRVAVSEHAVTVSSGGETLQVGEGQVATAGRGRVSESADADLSTELAWLDGRLVFISRPLGEVVAELERWQKGRILITDAALAQRPVTLIVDVQGGGSIPETLRQGLSVRVDSYSPWLTLIRPL